MKDKALRWIIGLFCIVWLIRNALAPIVAYAYFHDDYIQLSAACANAMDESWFAEQKKSTALDRTAQIHLLICHEYDKTRKIMLSLGLSEHVLSWLGLKALEINQRPAEEFVEQHRFRER